MAYKKGTGFHRLDADYTRGRGREMAIAQGRAKADMALVRRKVILRPLSDAPIINTERPER